MGPVSFEGLDAGSTRDEAMAAARRLEQAGVKITAVNQTETVAGLRFQIVIRSIDLPRAQAALADAAAEARPPDETGRDPKNS